MWRPEPWQGFLLLLTGGLLFLYFGISPLLPKYRNARKEIPTHPISYISSICIGIALVVWAFLDYLRRTSAG
jgi:hypothetical protein